MAYQLKGLSRTARGNKNRDQGFDPEGWPTETKKPAEMAVAYQRLMLPDDANPHGNVHGGTIMKMIEQAAYIAASRHLKRDAEFGGTLFAALARLDHMDFLLPMKIGDVAILSCKISFTAARSMEIQVKVERESMAQSTRQVTNRATLWYVTVMRGTGTISKADTHVPFSAWTLAPCPPLVLAAEDQAAGVVRYNRQRASRAASRAGGGDQATLDAARATSLDSRSALDGVVDATESQSQLMQLMLPSDCTKEGVVAGGVVMKLIDNAAGICAVRHCKTNVVTACIDDVDFRHKVHNGDLLVITANMQFTSAKSMEIHAEVTAQSWRTGETVTAVTARLTFVSLNPHGKAVGVPPLLPKSAGEKQAWCIAEDRYNAAKKARLAAKATAK